MPNNFSTTIKLMRLGNHTGYLLVFFPTMFGLLLASKDIYELLLFGPLFFLGSVVARSAGCIINDILDQEFDWQVKRTRHRPIASGQITNKEAIIVLYVLLMICLTILLSLRFMAIMVGIIAFIMMLIYPLMKRWTYFPQIFLGFTFNLGLLVAYAQVTDVVNEQAMLLYLACCFWTTGYDTIYAFMDLKDDKRIGVKSIAVLLENKSYKTFLAVCYGIFLLLFWYINQENGYNHKYMLVGIGLTAALLAWQVFTLNVQNFNNCLLRFKINNYVGGILVAAMLCEYLNRIFVLQATIDLM